MDREIRTETYDRTFATVTREGVDPARGDNAADLVIQTYSYEDDVEYIDGQEVARHRVTSMPEEVHADIPLTSLNDDLVIEALHAAGWEPTDSTLGPIMWSEDTIEVQPA